MVDAVGRNGVFIRQSAIKVVNLQPEPIATTIALAADFAPKTIDVAVLQGDLTAENTPDDPERIAPTHTTLDPSADPVEHTFPGHSFTVLRFQGD